jgi:23S rRNA (pseudouridine1915-N3)-methyltransferase
MRFRVVAVGKVRDTALRSVIEAFADRAGHYWPLEWIEVREESARSVDPTLVRAREGERLRQAAGSDAWVVACDGTGRTLDSMSFAQWMQRRQEAARDAALLIGGAFGLDDALREGANERLAVAPWTLPHDLARLVLAEQLYRAGTIMRGEPYHK